MVVEIFHKGSRGRGREKSKISLFPYPYILCRGREKSKILLYPYSNMLYRSREKNKISLFPYPYQEVNQSEAEVKLINYCATSRGREAQVWWRIVSHTVVFIYWITPQTCHRVIAPLNTLHRGSSGVRGIFFKGGKITFPDLFLVWMFFPGRSFDFGTPKPFSGSKSENQNKKQTNKKMVLYSFSYFSPSLSKFYNFPSFLLHFPPFSLPLFSR